MKNSTSAQRRYAGRGHAIYLALFAFYACALFIDGVFLPNYAKHDDIFNICLTRSAHVDSVHAAMVVIFPMLLQPKLFSSSATTVSSSLVTVLLEFNMTITYQSHSNCFNRK